MIKQSPFDSLLTSYLKYTILEDKVASIDKNSIDNYSVLSISQAKDENDKTVEPRKTSANVSERIISLVF
ncbi:MAG: hypothetical protein ACJA0U_000894 [Salibacteraceae bacterium]|jgi:hypothetical protein